MDKSGTNPKDHDLLVRLDEKVNGLIGKVDGFTTVTLAFDNRIRKVEDDVNLMKPIPAYSHQQVVEDIAQTKRDIEGLKEQKSKLIGGWQAIVIMVGSISGIVTMIWMLSQIIPHVCLTACR